MNPVCGMCHSTGPKGSSQIYSRDGLHGSEGSADFSRSFHQPWDNSTDPRSTRVSSGVLVVAKGTEDLVGTLITLPAITHAVIMWIDGRIKLKMVRRSPNMSMPRVW